MTPIKSEKEIQENFIKRCNEKHPNKLDYSKTIYKNYKTPCIFICKLCSNEFTRDPLHMLGKGRGHGCNICNRGVRDSLETFIKKANKTHNNKYNYDLVIYVNSLTKVKIKCPIGHIFEQTPNHHINGDGCPYCMGRYRTTEEFINMSKIKFPNIKFDYSKTKLVNMSTLVTIICYLGHEFKVLPRVHLRENSLGGCRECANIRTGETNRYSQEEWIKLAKLKHDNLYLYDKVVYVNSQTEVIITCKKHGDFKQNPTSHIGGAGCRNCAIERSIKSKILTEEELQERIILAHKVHNNKYTYNGIYRDKELRIEVICDKHGMFNQRLEHHIKGHGCYKCSVQYSKQQIEWLEYRTISDGYIQHACNSGEYRINGTLLFADGYNKETNTIYEFQGDFWHGNPKIFKHNDINPRINTTYGSLYEKTQKKIEKMKELGYNICEIWESDWDKGKKAVTSIQRIWRSLHSK